MWKGSVSEFLGSRSRFTVEPHTGEAPLLWKGRFPSTSDRGSHCALRCNLISFDTSAIRSAFRCYSLRDRCPLSNLILRRLLVNPACPFSATNPPANQLSFVLRPPSGSPLLHSASPNTEGKCKHTRHQSLQIMRNGFIRVIEMLVLPYICSNIQVQCTNPSGHSQATGRRRSEPFPP